MEEQTRKRSIVCFVISMVDYFGGEVIFNTTHIEKIYNNDDDFVIIDTVDGSSFLLEDMNLETLQGDIDEWKNMYQDKFDSVLDYMKGIG